MAKGGNLIGSAGTYYVAARLNSQGWHAAITTGNAPDIDVIATIDDHPIAIQVKTATYAKRKDHLEWAFNISHAERLAGRRIWYVLVDLDEFAGLPDLYVVPPELVVNYYVWFLNEWCGGDPSKWGWKRFHPPFALLAPFKNNFDLLRSVAPTEDALKLLW